MSNEIRGNVRNVWVSVVIVQLTLIIGHPEYLHPQDIQFDTRFLWSRSTPSIQQAILSFDKVPQ